MNYLDGDALGVVLEYATLHEAVRLLTDDNCKPVPYGKLCRVLSKRACTALLQRVSSSLLFSPLDSVRSIAVLQDSALWQRGAIAVLRRCSYCPAKVQWKDPGWTTDASLLCWRHYQHQYQGQIKTAKELAEMCGSKSIPRVVKRKYTDLQLQRKKTAIGAYLYFIEPLQAVIQQCAAKRHRPVPDESSRRE